MIRFMKGDQWDLDNLKYDSHTSIEPVSCYLKDSDTLLYIKEDNSWKDVLQITADELRCLMESTNGMSNYTYNEVEDLKKRVEKLEEELREFGLKNRFEISSGIFDLIGRIEEINA